MKRSRKPGYILELDGRLTPLSEWYLRFSSKRKRRKGHYMKNFHHWVGRNQVTKRRAAREERQRGKHIDPG